MKHMTAKKKTRLFGIPTEGFFDFSTRSTETEGMNMATKLDKTAQVFTEKTPARTVAKAADAVRVIQTFDIILDAESLDPLCALMA